MVRFFKSVIKRVLIIVLVAIVLGFLRNYFNFLILNVYAEDRSDMVRPYIQVGIDSTTDSNKKVSEYVGLKTNVDYLAKDNNINFNYFEYSANGERCYNNIFCYVGSSPSPGYKRKNLNQNNVVEVSESVGYLTYISNFKYNFGDNFVVKNNNHYTLFMFIEKDSDLLFKNSFNLNENDIRIYVNSIEKNQNNSSFLPFDNFSNITGVFDVVYTSRDHSISNQSNYAFFQIDFDIFSTSSLTDDNHDLFFNRIEILFGSESIYTQPLPLNYFLRNKTNVNSNHNFKIDTYFIENGVVSLQGQNCDTSSGMCNSHVGRHDNYDYVMEQDIEVLDSIGVCEPTDIICHIKRVFDMIWRFFIRISNFFSELFDDSFNFDLDTNSDMTPVSNLLSLPITLLNRFLTAFQGNCSPYFLGSLLGTNLILPCINLNNYLGSTLFNVIDIICSSFIFYNIALLCIHMFDKWTSLTDDFDELYSPKHEYHGKHEGGR